MTEEDEFERWDAIEVAVDLLDARCYGRHTVFAYWAPEIRRVVIVADDAMADLGRRLRHGRSGGPGPKEVYSLWCEVTAREVVDPADIAIAIAAHRAGNADVDIDADVDIAALRAEAGNAGDIATVAVIDLAPGF